MHRNEPPLGSEYGVEALSADRFAGTHCLEFARSSVDYHNGEHLTYIPFATDAVAYVTLAGSNISRNLTIGQLQQIYNCTVTTGYQPLLSNYYSGTRRFFLQRILGFTDSQDFTTLHPCVSDNDPTNPGNFLVPNTGNKLTTTSTQIEPYAVSSWIARNQQERGRRPRQNCAGKHRWYSFALVEFGCDRDSAGVQRYSQQAGRRRPEQ